MKIYRVRASGEFYSMVAAEIPRQARDEIAHAVFYGRSLVPEWRPIPCSRLDPELKWGSFSDFNILAALPIVFEKTLIAVPHIRQYFEEAGELLPIQVEACPGYVVNITKILNAISRPDSRLRRMSNGCEVTNFPVFQKTKSPGSGFFRINESWGSLYLAEPECGGFKKLYDENGLTALVFKECPTV